MEQFTIAAGLLQDIVNYLASRPYAETYQLINAIQNLKRQEMKESRQELDNQTNTKQSEK